MRKGQQIVCRYLLERFPDHFTLLERDKDNYKLIIAPNDLRLIVPEKICVWNVNPGAYRARREYLFASRTDGNPVFDNAYLSYIPLREKYKEDKVIGNLLDYPWFNLSLSSGFFHKIVSRQGTGPVYIWDSKSNNPKERYCFKHPLDRQPQSY